MNVQGSTIVLGTFGAYSAQNGHLVIIGATVLWWIDRLPLDFRAKAVHVARYCYIFLRNESTPDSLNDEGTKKAYWLVLCIQRTIGRLFVI